MKRAIIYTRISKDPLNTELGVQRQEKECRALCEQRGYTVTEVHSDNDSSGYSGKRRAGWVAVAESIRSGRVDVLVAWHPSRFTRHPRELEDLIDLLEASRVKVATVTAGDYDLSNSAGRMTARVVGAVARGESEQKSEKLRSKALQTAMAGEIHGGGHLRPFGFESDTITHRPDEAEAIRWAAAQIVSGTSVRSVCASMSIGPVSARAWSAATLRRVLLSPRIAGLRQHRGEVIGKACWEPILDRECWELTRAILSDPQRKTWRPSARYLLTGGTIVDSLGRVMIARPSSSTRRCYVSLPDMLGPRGKRRPGMRIGAAETDEMVLEMVKSVAASNLEQLPRDLPGDDIEALEAELAELLALRVAGKITLPEYLALTALPKSRLANAKPSTRVDAAGLLRRYDSLTISEMRAVVHELVDRVVIKPAVRGRNTFDRSRVMIELKLGGIAVP